MTHGIRIGQQQPSGETSPKRAAIAGILGVGAIAGPLAFGATEVWAYCSLQVLVAIAAVLWAFSRAVGWRQLLLPLAIVMLGAVQLVPLSESLSERIAPLCFKARQEVQPLVDAPLAVAVSVNSAQTAAALRRCLMLALVVTIVADVACVDRYRQWLIRCVAGVGVAVVLLALLVGEGPERKALGFHNRDGYWKFYKNPLLSGFEGEGMGYPDAVTVGNIYYASNAAAVGKALGVMINANHFAACAGMTLPVIVSLLLSATGSSTSKWRWWGIAAACGCVLIVAYAVAVPAHARAGIAGIVATGVIVACLALPRTRTQRRITLIGLFVVIAAVALLALRFGRAEWFGGRRETWSASLEMFRASPLLGVGLGNYQSVYPALRSGAVAYFAHSAWLEVAAESGLVGIALLATTIAWGAWSVTSGWKRDATRSTRVLRWGVVGGLSFAAFHGAFDHGVQIPGNAYLCAVLIGILLADVRSDLAVRNSTSGSGRLLSLFMLLVVTSMGGLLVYGAICEVEANRLMMPLRRAIAMQRVPNKNRELDEKPELLEVSLPDAIRAFELKRHDATFADYLGQAFLHLSRGVPGPELNHAEEWFCRSLQLCPLNPWTVKTLSMIREQKGLHPRPETTRKNANRGAVVTSARPGRWGL